MTPITTTTTPGTITKLFTTSNGSSRPTAILTATIASSTRTNSNNIGSGAITIPTVTMTINDRRLNSASCLRGGSPSAAIQLDDSDEFSAGLTQVAAAACGFMFSNTS